MSPSITLVVLLGLALLLWAGLQLANETKDAEQRRRARIAVLVVGIVILAAWLFGWWPFTLPRLRGG